MQCTSAHCKIDLSTPTVYTHCTTQTLNLPRSQLYAASKSALLSLTVGLNVSITQPQSKHYFASKLALLSLKVSLTQPQRQQYSASKSALLSLKVSITQPQSQFYSVSAYKSGLHKKFYIAVSSTRELRNGAFECSPDGSPTLPRATRVLCENNLCIYVYIHIYIYIYICIYTYIRIADQSNLGLPLKALPLKAYRSFSMLINPNHFETFLISFQ